jgi:hypothetical protein
LLGQGAAELAACGVGALRAGCSSCLGSGGVDTTCVVAAADGAELARGATEADGAAVTADATLGPPSAFEEGRAAAGLRGTVWDFSRNTALTTAISADAASTQASFGVGFLSGALASRVFVDAKPSAGPAGPPDALSADPI